MVLPVALFAWLGGCEAKAPLDVPSWLRSQPGTAAIFYDEHVPCGPKGRARPPHSCSTNRIVTIAAVKPDAFAPEDPSDESGNPFRNAAVTIKDSGKMRRVRGSQLGFIIPDGTAVFCPKIGWWNPPSEFFYGPRGDTRLLPPVRVRVGKLVTVETDYGDEFFAYQIEVLDGRFAGERGTADGLSPSCELADRPGVTLVFH